MGLCHKCDRPLPPNQRCLYCGSPEFEKLEGETKRRSKRDALTIWTRRLFWLGLLGAIAWFFAFTPKGKSIVSWIRDVGGF